MSTVNLGEIVHFNKEKQVKKLSINYDMATERFGNNNYAYVQSGGVFFNIMDYNKNKVSIKLGMNEVTDLISRLQKAVDLNLNAEIKISEKQKNK